MKNQLFVIVIISLFIIFPRSQDNTEDSLKAGKKCFLTLTNGYENMVDIINVSADSVSFKTGVKEFTIPRSQVLFVNRADYVIEQFVNEENKVFTSDECDLYTEGGKTYQNVSLICESDSSIMLIRKVQLSPDFKKIINISDIRKLEFTGAGFGRGMLIGSLIGFGLGLAFCLSLPEHGEYHRPPFESIIGISFVCAGSSGLIGGLIGAIFRRDDIYLFPPGYSNTKAKRIKYLIEKHKQ